MSKEPKSLQEELPATLEENHQALIGAAKLDDMYLICEILENRKKLKGYVHASRSIPEASAAPPGGGEEKNPPYLLNSWQTSELKAYLHRRARDYGGIGYENIDRFIDEYQSDMQDTPPASKTLQECKDAAKSFRKDEHYYPAVAAAREAGFIAGAEYANQLQAREWQLCPKCNGQGIVSKPPYVAGDVHQWASSSSSFTCDVCNGVKVLLPPNPPQSE